MIRVLLADDSMLVRMVLRDALNSAEGIDVVGEAINGREAVSLTETLRPDIVIMDIMMPEMGGLEATEVIMANCPTPILVLSATLDNKDVKLAFTAIKKGALDVMGKPEAVTSSGQGEFIARLIDRVRLLARIKVIHHIHKERRPPIPVAPGNGKVRNILAIGASTGGPKAVMSILKTLPKGFPAAVFIVQHISSGFASGFAHWLDLESVINVRLAATGDLPEAGTALVAPTDCQMLFESGRIKLVDAPAVNSCRPSIDVFFKSLAGGAAAESVGVLLTGMGRDGAQGLSLLREKGCLTIAQDEKSSVVFGMPKAAIALNAAERVLPLDAIPEALTHIFHY
jgi:two-component system chemotaxis response regulator CheB